MVVYPEQVKGLIAPDGSVRTGLSLGDLARLLGVSPQQIAKNTSSVEVGTDAVLFNVVIARLSKRPNPRHDDYVKSRFARACHLRRRVRNGCRPSCRLA